MECWLNGAFALDHDAGGHLGRPLSVRLWSPLRSVFAAWRTRSLRVTGELDADALAHRRPVDGEVRFNLRRVLYRLRFEDDEGCPCTLECAQRLELKRPPNGFSVLDGEIWLDRQRRGRARLRLDPRGGLRGVIPWA